MKAGLFQAFEQMVADFLRAELGRESPCGVIGIGNWVRVDFVRSFDPIAAITFHQTYREIDTDPQFHRSRILGPRVEPIRRALGTRQLLDGFSILSEIRSGLKHDADMTALHPPATEEQALRALLNRIIPVFQPQAVYLFGSRAEGRAGLESDWDLLVVVPDDTPAERLTVLAGYEAVRGSGVPADVVPTRRSRFEVLKEQVGSLSYAAWHRGRLVYGA